MLQAGGSYTHVGKALPRLCAGLPAAHGDPHLDALCSQRQEGLLRHGAEGRQRLGQRSGQRVSVTRWKLEAGLRARLVVMQRD